MIPGLNPLAGLGGLPTLPGGLPGGPLGGLPGGLPGLGGLGRPPLPGLGAPSLPGLPGLGALGGLPGLPTLPGLRPGGLPGLPGLRPPLGQNALRPQLGATMPGIRPAGIVRPPGTMPAPALSKAGGLPPPISGSLAKAPGIVPAVKPGEQPVPGAGSPAPCTVYVGRISSEVSDDFVRQLLEKCGTVTKWNRAADPNTSKLTSFGFCDFETPSGVWRALEYLHEKQLCDKRLLVKCEEKAKQTIDEWKESRRDELAKAKDSEDPKPLNDEQMHEELTKESQDVAEAIQKLLAEKNKGFPELSTETDDKEEVVAIEEGKLVKADEAKDKEDAAEKKENGAAATKDRSRSRSRGKRKTRSEERREEKEREREREKKAAVSKYYRPSRRERDREQRIRDRERDIEKEYGYRLRELERGEDHRIKNLKRDFRDLEQAEPSERERRKFAEEDLNFGKRESQERDWKRYREDRARERQKEREKDNADRALVAKEEEAEKKRKQEKEEEERKKREAEEAERKRLREEEERRKQQEIEEIARKKREAEEAERRRIEEEEMAKKRAEEMTRQKAAADKLIEQIREELKNFKIEKARENEPAVTGSVDGPSRDDRKKAAGGAAGEKLRDDEMRRLIQQVPTEKAKAFAFEIDWDVVHDNQIIEKKLRPWVRKKVTEYLGSEEQGMIDFIMRKVAGQAPPSTILAELEGFLDEEAENFTLKMWRMLIFEVLRVKAR